MKISIIANGFQEHYIINLINSRACTVDSIDFIGSDIYPKEKIDKRINFLNLRGNHDENVSIARKSYRMLAYYFRLFNYLFRTESKIIHIQWYRFYLLEGLIISLFARLIGKKAIYTAHDVLPHNRETRANKLIFWLIYRLQSMIIVHTGFIRERLVKEFGICEDKIKVIKHGVYEVSEHDNIDMNIARQRYGFSSDDFILLFFGIITKYKGLPLLLEAFEKNYQNNNIKLLIAGNVSADYADDMVAIKKKYCRPEIVMIIRYIKDEEVPFIFNSANATILPYTEASQSGVLFMSYAYGKPVVAPNIGGFPYDIIHGVTGYLFEAGDTNKLGMAMQTLISDWKNKPKSANDNIKKFARENYSWKQSASELREIYDSLVLKKSQSIN